MDINDTCKSIIETIKRIEENQLQFYENMMKMVEIVNRNVSK